MINITGKTKFIFLTASGSWTVPIDWNSQNNAIECIGGGGAGGYGSNANGNGGGGGGYGVIFNLALTPGASIPFTIGAGGVPYAFCCCNYCGSAAGPTYFNEIGRAHV